MGIQQEQISVPELPIYHTIAQMLVQGLGTMAAAVCDQQLGVAGSEIVGMCAQAPLTRYGVGLDGCGSVQLDQLSAISDLGIPTRLRDHIMLQDYDAVSEIHTVLPQIEMADPAALCAGTISQLAAICQDLHGSRLPLRRIRRHSGRPYLPRPAPPI